MKLSITTSILLFCLLTACNSIKDPEFQRMENAKFKTATLQGDIVLIADAIFNNPNSVGVNLEEVELEVFVDKKKVADVTQSIDTKVGANTDFTVPLEIRVPIKHIFEEAKEGLFDSVLKNRKALVKMEGTVEVSIAKIRHSVPFEYEQEYEFGLGF